MVELSELPLQIKTIKPSESVIPLPILYETLSDPCVSLIYASICNPTYASPDSGFTKGPKDQLNS